MFWLIKHVFKDVSILYKNFLHWNISKISIWIFGFLIALTIMIPFLLITFLLLFILNVDWYSYTGHLVNGSLTHEMVLHKDFFLWAFMWIINIVVFFLGWSYAKVIYFDMNLKYLDHKKPKYNKMRFFHFPIIWNYYKMSSLIALILSIPLIIWVILFSLIVSWAGWVNNAGVLLTNGNTALAMWLLVLAILVTVSFIYLSYRFYYSYILFVKNHDSEHMDFSAKDCIRKSWNITKWFKKLLKLVWILFIFAVILLPFNIVEESLNNTYEDIRNYQIFTEVSESTQLQLQESDPYYYGSLAIKYQQVSADDLQKNIQIYYNLIIFFNIILFLFISWVIEMVMVSFYKRVLTHK